jgi:hypothetical protein
MKNQIAAPRSIVLVMLAGWVALCVPVWAQQSLPDALLRVTVQQKEQDRLNPELHVQELSCWRGECSLSSITLNSCRPSPVSDGKASPLIIERSSTREGSLAVTKEGDTLVAVETGSDIGGRYVTTQRFRYENPRDGAIVRKLVGYSGGFVKNSVIAQQVVAVQFVPFQGAFKEVRLDCPLGLPGVDALER